MGSKHQLNPTLVFFWKLFFFHFQKKLQVLTDPVVVNFFEMHLIQHFFFGNEKKKIFPKKFQVWDQSTNQVQMDRAIEGIYCENVELNKNSENSI